MQSEEQLVEEAKRGNQDSFARLIELHKQIVYNLILQMAPNEAEDLTQEVFIKAYYNLPKFRGESSFKTWIIRIAINHCKNYHRKTKLKQAIFADQVVKWKESSDTEMLHIKACLQQLTYKHREVVVLHDLLGFKYSEIGEMLNLSPGTVKSRLYYARSALKHHLTERK